MTKKLRFAAFCILAIAILLLGYFYLNGFSLFKSSNNYYVVFDRVDGLYKGNQVVVNGYPVGRVDDMQFSPSTGNIVTTLALNRNLMIPKSDSTYAMLVSSDLLGSKKINIVFGQSNLYFKNGDTLKTMAEQHTAKTPVLESLFSPLIDTIAARVVERIMQSDTIIIRKKGHANQGNSK